MDKDGEEKSVIGSEKRSKIPKRKMEAQGWTIESAGERVVVVQRRDTKQDK